MGRRRRKGRGDGPRSPRSPDPVENRARGAPEEAEQPEPEPEDPRAAAGGSPADAGPSPGAPRRRRRARYERGSESTRYLSAWERIHTRGKSLCAVLAKGEGEGAAGVERRQPFASDSATAHSPVLTRPAEPYRRKRAYRNPNRSSITWLRCRIVPSCAESSPVVSSFWVVP